MTDIPRQRTGTDTCGHCGQPVHLVNSQLGPEWTHDADNSPWCALRAVPVSMPWPEGGAV